MPKVEIHCHLFGTVRLDTLLALRDKYQVPRSREELAGFKDFGFGLDHLRQFMLNGLDGAWISNVTRRQWKRDWTREFDRLRAQLQEEPQPAADQQFD